MKHEFCRSHFQNMFMLRLVFKKHDNFIAIAKTSKIDITMRNTIALTMPKVSQWKNKRCLCLERNSYKVILIILLWQFSTSLIYNLLFKPLMYEQYLDSETAITLTCMGAFILLFSPLAGIMYDVKLGRFKVQKYSTHIMLVAIIVTLLALILVSTINKKVGFLFYLIVALLTLSAHVREGYSSHFVCQSVSQSVTFLFWRRHRFQG